MVLMFSMSGCSLYYFLENKSFKECIRKTMGIND